MLLFAIIQFCSGACEKDVIRLIEILYYIPLVKVKIWIKGVDNVRSCMDLDLG